MVLFIDLVSIDNKLYTTSAFRKKTICLIAILTWYVFVLITYLTMYHLITKDLWERANG